MKKIILLTVVILELSPAIFADVSPLNVFGPDDRVSTTHFVYPDNLIVKIKIPGEECSGALIGKNLVLTAAHCVLPALSNPQPWNATGDFNLSQRNDVIKTIDVYVQYTGVINFKDRAAATSVYVGAVDMVHDFDRDLAILVINKNLGEKYGYFEFAMDDRYFEIIKNNLTLGAYDIWQEARDLRGNKYIYLGYAITTQCSVRKKFENGIIFHDCDAARGSSGAPIMDCTQGDKCFVIGVNTGEYRMGGSSSLHKDSYTDDFANVGIRVNKYLLNIVRALR